MLTPDRILLASDFSASAEAALLYAAALARQLQASLCVMHVIDTRVAALPHWTDIFRATEVFAKLAAADMDALQRLLTHPALTGLTVETMVQHGSPWERITDMAPYADLVVMGTGGQDTARGRSAGNTARQVAHACTVPVLLVPPDAGQVNLPDVGAARLPCQRILLALNLAQYAPQAIRLSQALTAACQATMLVLQVVEPDKTATYPVDTGEGLHRNLDALTVLLEKRLAEVVPDDPSGPPIERLVLVGQPAEVIQQQIVSRGVDLAVLSTHAYSTLKRLFTLSTVDAILETAPCPLLAIPWSRPVIG
jgi:nucleotide-binding universal stress UspA family protein